MSTEREAAEYAAFVAHHFSSYERRYKAGDAEALLEALDWGLAYREMPPAWMCAHISAALKRFFYWEAATLDDAFRVVRSKDPRTIATQRRKVQLIGDITQHIWQQQDAGARLNEEFFAATGKKFGVSATRVKQYWKEGNAVWGNAFKKPKKRHRVKKSA